MLASSIAFKWVYESEIRVVHTQLNLLVKWIDIIVLFIQLRAFL